MKSGRFLNLPLFLWLPGIRSKARVRLRESSQRHETVANAVLGDYSSEDLKITGVEINQKDDLILTSAAYGAGMTLDLFCELKTKELLELQDAVMFVGSMGSFNGVESKMLQFLRENAYLVKNAVNPNKNGYKKQGIRVPPSAPAIAKSFEG